MTDDREKSFWSISIGLSRAAYGKKKPLPIHRV